MEGWIEICEETKKKLNRELLQREIEFIKWICERHQREEEIKAKF